MIHVALHVLLYTVGIGLLVAVWIASGGDPGALRRPLEAGREHGFWPLWPALGWGALLALHLGITVIVAARRGVEGGGDPDEGGTEPRQEWMAVLFVDIVDSTRLAERLGDEDWSDLIVRLREIARDRAAEHGGDDVGTQGDGVLLRFPSPRRALRCAADLQGELATDVGGSEVVSVRIGVHAGHVVHRDGDVLGRMVNVASRVADQASPGEVLVTEPVAEQADPGVELEDRGLVELPGVDSPRHLLRLMTDGSRGGS